MAASQSPQAARSSAHDIIPRIIGAAIWTRYDPENPVQCISNKADGSRCRMRRGIANRSHGLAMYIRLAKLDPHQESTECLDTIKAFFDAAFCHHHCNTAKDKAELRFRKACSEDLEANSVALTQDLQNKLPRSDAANTTYSATQQDTPFVSSTSHGTRSSPRTCAALKDMDLFDLNDPTWERYYQTEWAAASVSQSIRQTLLRPLAKCASEGQLYCYSTPSYPGFVKVGRTSRSDPTARTREWEYKCKRQACLEFATYTQVQSAERLEALVFAELAPYRFRERECPGCHCKHQEWFQIPPEHAKIVALKWSRFMESRPYALDDSGTWHLRRKVERDTALLDELCTPLELESSSTSPIKSTDIKASITRAGRNMQDTEKVTDEPQLPPSPSVEASKTLDLVRIVRSPEPVKRPESLSAGDITPLPPLQSPPPSPTQAFDPSSSLAIMSSALSVMVAAATQLLNATNQSHQTHNLQIKQLQSALRTIEAAAA